MWIISRVWPEFTLTFPLKDALAMLIAMVGGVICGIGVTLFLRARTTLNPIKPDQASCLVVNGIYRYTRNPMYLGFFFVLVAWGIYLANAPALLFMPLVFVAYMNRFQIEPEEQALEVLFGERYRMYKDQVHRWI